jgi:pyruvate/2-oxoglutarate dehydrogenase complex dihydrolipoamide acyltransferase (E2) component
MRELRMPQLGQTMTEGTILKWLKQEGETVRRGEPLVEVETDKVVMVVESPEEGRLLKILRAENETVPVGEAIAWIGESEQAQP